MSYVEKNLIANENIVYRGSLHWLVVASPAAFTAACLFAAIGLSRDPKTSGVSGLFVFLVLMGVGAIFAGWLNRASSEFVVTDKRVVVKSGFIRRKTLEQFHEKVESLAIDQTIMGRILNFGTLGVVGSGGSKSLFHRLGAPMDFRKAFYEQVEKNKAANGKAA
jgi:uncharacterized membrane protein YdbT with pleckstrin-like domain